MIVKNYLRVKKKKGRRSVLFPYISEMVKVIANLFHSIVINKSDCISTERNFCEDSMENRYTSRTLNKKCYHFGCWAIFAPADPYLGNYHKSQVESV